MAKVGRGHQAGKLTRALAQSAHDPKTWAAAAAVLVAGGAAATGKLLRDRRAERDRQRAHRYRLEPGESPLDGIARVARGQLDLATESLERSRGGARDEAVHEARKALKRLRTAVRLSRDHLGDERYRRENGSLRDAGRRLGGSRDARVLLDTLDGLHARHPEVLPGEPWPRLRAALAVDARGTEGDGDAQVVATLAAVRERVATWPLPREAGAKTLGPGFERIYRRGRRALRTATAEPSTEHLHELRKRVKDLWHAAQLLRPVAPKRMKKLARRSHRVADLLGEDHDLAVLAARARERPELLAATELQVLEALVGRERAELQREALGRARKLYRHKPRRLVRALLAV